jgi:hypothetical protein
MDEIFKYKKSKYNDHIYFCSPIDYGIKVVSNNNQERKKIYSYLC